MPALSHWRINKARMLHVCRGQQPQGVGAAGGSAGGAAQQPGGTAGAATQGPGCSAGHVAARSLLLGPCAAAAAANAAAAAALLLPPVIPQSRHSRSIEGVVAAVVDDTVGLSGAATKLQTQANLQQAQLQDTKEALLRCARGMFAAGGFLEPAAPHLGPHVDVLQARKSCCSAAGHAAVHARTLLLIVLLCMHAGLRKCFHTCLRCPRPSAQACGTAACRRARTLRRQPPPPAAPARHTALAASMPACCPACEERAAAWCGVLWRRRACCVSGLTRCGCS